MKHPIKAFLAILSVTLLLIPAFAMASDNNEELIITPPAEMEEEAAYLQDGDAQTRLTLSRKQSLTVSWSCADAAYLLINWYEPASNIVITLYDESGTAVNETKYTDTAYRQCIDISGASSMMITAGKDLSSISELTHFHAGETVPYLSDDTQADILLILSKPTDEYIVFGGLVPYLIDQNISTAICVVGEEYGYVVNEMYSALTALDYVNSPIFLHKEDQHALSENRVQMYWGRSKTLDAITKVINSVSPKVVITVDPDDTGAEASSRYTAQLVSELAGSGKFSSIEKFYTVSSSGSTVVSWDQPLAYYGGKTAAEAASEAYSLYDSQTVYHRSIPLETAFSLGYSAVGADSACDDLLENIDLSALTPYRDPAALPSATPVPEITPEPDTPSPVPTVAPSVLPEESTASPAETAVQTAEDKASAFDTAAVLYCVLLLLCLAAIAITLIHLRKKPAKPFHKVIIAIAAVAAAASLILFILKMTGSFKEKSAEASPAPTASPTPSITAVSQEASHTAEPTASPTPSPTPDPKESLFLQSDDEVETYISDYDNGYWEYRSKDLAIYIDRREFTLDGNPQCIFVAHIYVRNSDSFRSGLASRSVNAETLLPPWKLARSYKAVLAITGDNLTNAEKELKGILIRNGVYYSDYQKADTLVIKSPTELAIVEKGTVSGLKLLDSGIKNTYSFGPTLVKDGVKCSGLESNRVYRGNPRTGIGMVEEGHFVAIVADGRDPNRSFNLTLDQFADLFVEEGVQFAYNLDGGSSAAMIFMGESVNWHSGKDDPQRTWVDALMWGYSDAVPGVNDPVTHTGDGDTY